MTMTRDEARALLPRVDNKTFRADNNHYLVGRFGCPIKLSLLHNTETMEPGNAPSGLWLSHQSPAPSAHHLYGRDGTRYDIVDRANTAYHAGSARWGVYGGSINQVGVVNLISIGHELESSSTLANPGNRYTDAQLNSLAYTLATEMVSYGYGWEGVADHANVALPHGRRHDPSHFDDLRGPGLNTYRQELYIRTERWVEFLRSLPADELAEWCI